MLVVWLGKNLRQRARELKTEQWLHMAHWVRLALQPAQYPGQRPDAGLPTASSAAFLSVQDKDLSSEN